MLNQNIKSYLMFTSAEVVNSLHVSVICEALSRLPLTPTHTALSINKWLMKIKLFTGRFPN